MVHERWTNDYSSMWASKLTTFKHNVEKAQYE